MLTELANEIHEQNVHVGWWDACPVKSARYETAMMLVITELAEACEGDRKNLMDTHIPEFKMFDMELADTAIRLFDLAGALEVDLSGNGAAMASIMPTFFDLDTPEQLYRAVKQMTLYHSPSECIRYAVASVFCIAKLHDIDLLNLVAIKREYNAKRLDHKRSERAKTHGKKY